MLKKKKEEKWVKAMLVNSILFNLKSKRMYWSPYEANFHNNTIWPPLAQSLAKTMTWPLVMKTNYSFSFGSWIGIGVHGWGLSMVDSGVFIRGGLTTNIFMSFLWVLYISPMLEDLCLFWESPGKGDGGKESMIGWSWKRWARARSCRILWRL